MKRHHGKALLSLLQYSEERQYWLGVGKVHQELKKDKSQDSFVRTGPNGGKDKSATSSCNDSGGSRLQGGYLEQFDRFIQDGC